MVKNFLLILINFEGLIVNTGFFLIVRQMHKFSESISVKAGSKKSRLKLSCFLGQQQEFTNCTLFSQS